MVDIKGGEDEKALNDETMKELTGETDDEYNKRCEVVMVNGLCEICGDVADLKDNICLNCAERSPLI